MLTIFVEEPLPVALAEEFINLLHLEIMASMKGARGMNRSKAVLYFLIMAYIAYRVTTIYSTQGKCGTST